ncbi:hypothetical protein CA267_017155 [Alteromonas pelagimontana]|uniref:Uncharacterized protein n=1 Tax=Alteromonas pelagimontana TaxID=1858656 RepID=A0A6M4MGN6_9ALTE|nr:hypothetical protein [Alteromonas pelagimontana]QJR82354.1 hypothetical protein CA267_017155 [Alteromonas pelagimontana]
MNDIKKPEVSAEDMKHINGWGIDADPDNDPTYPLQQRDKAAHEVKWDRPKQQPVDQEVLHSIERPDVTAVYGTSAAPSGISGMLRRIAFRYGEGRFAHWLPLVLADRINSVEGIVSDLCHGRVTNVFKEKGMKAQWEHNRPAVIKKAAVTAVVVTGVAWWLSSRKNK